MVSHLNKMAMHGYVLAKDGNFARAARRVSSTPACLVKLVH